MVLFIIDDSPDKCDNYAHKMKMQILYFGLSRETYSFPEKSDYKHKIPIFIRTAITITCNINNNNKM